MAGSTGKIDAVATLRFGRRRKDYGIGFATLGKDSAGRDVLEVRLLAVPPHGRVMLALGDIQRLLAREQGAEGDDLGASPERP